MRADVLEVLRQAGTTSILVTHDQDEALSMADQVAVLRHGVIAQLDTPAALYGHPEDPELAQFLGESNVLEGEVRDRVAVTALGRLELGTWAGPTGRGTGPGHGATRADRAGRGGGGLGGGHRGELRVLRARRRGAGPARMRTGLPDLVVRVVGGVPLELGRRVGLSVRGPVVAWPMEPAEPAGSSE